MVIEPVYEAPVGLNHLKIFYRYFQFDGFLAALA